MGFCFRMDARRFWGCWRLVSETAELVSSLQSMCLRGRSSMWNWELRNKTSRSEEIEQLWREVMEQAAMRSAKGVMIEEEDCNSLDETLRALADLVIMPRRPWSGLYSMEETVQYMPWIVASVGRRMAALAVDTSAALSLIPEEKALEWGLDAVKQGAAKWVNVNGYGGVKLVGLVRFDLEIGGVEREVQTGVVKAGAVQFGERDIICALDVIALFGSVEVDPMRKTLTLRHRLDREKEQCTRIWNPGREWAFIKRGEAEFNASLSIVENEECKIS